MKILNGILTAIFIALAASAVSAQTTAFNYQGKLTDGGVAANGTFQMQFRLFDALSGGAQIGATLSDVPVTVAQGVFAVKLDFGANALSGANRWLEIAVRRNSGESYVTLAPREQIGSSPYSVRTLSAASADNALNLGGIPASDYVTNTNGGSSFIRNGTTQQTGNFNISGNGTIATQLGVGKLAAPGNRIDSLGTIRSFDTVSTSIVAETGGGTNAWARFYAITPSQRWSWGSSNGFNGNQFYLNDETFGQSRMTIQPNGGAITFPFGLVGIGTTAPNAGLELRGTGALTQQRITDNTSGNSLVLQSGSGDNMKVTGYNYNTSAAVPLYLSADGANTFLGGNAAQPRGNGGLPKAMLYVDAGGAIIRCFNGVTGSSSGNCGFSVTETQIGVYRIDFGFQVNDRFLYLTGGSDDRLAIWESGCQGCTANQLLVYVVNTAGVSVHGRFMAIVF